MRYCAWLLHISYRVGTRSEGTSAHFSELLEEDEEPFEVLPGGIINAPLAVTLRVLTASDDIFQSWTTLEGAHMQRCSLCRPARRPGPLALGLLWLSFCACGA